MVVGAIGYIVRYDASQYINFEISYVITNTHCHPPPLADRIGFNMLL